MNSSNLLEKLSIISCSSLINQIRKDDKLKQIIMDIIKMKDE